MKKLKIEYTRCEAGWLEFTIIYDKTKLDYTFSYVFDDPSYLIKWAEDVYSGNYKEYISNAEGWCWYFDYDGEYFIVSDTKNKKDENPEYGKYQRLKITMDKSELCKEIYTSLKRFQKSGLYNPREWESLSFVKLIQKVYSSNEEAIENLSSLNLEQITNFIKQKYQGPFNFENLYFFSDNPEYDEASKNERIEIIKDNIEANDDYTGYGGHPILEIKSEILEKL